MNKPVAFNVIKSHQINGDITLGETSISESIKLILDAIDLGILVNYSRGIVINSNPKFLEMWQVPEDIINCQDSSKLLAFCNRQLKEPILAPYLTEKNNIFLPRRDSKILELKDGRVFEQSSQLISLNGELNVRVWTFRDITDPRCFQTKFQQLLEQNKQVGETKNRFISMISHEFRSSLNIISLATSVLKRHVKVWSEEKKDSYFNQIQSAVEQINYLIDTILLIGRAELKKLKFEPELNDLNQFCLNLIEEFPVNSSDPTLIYQDFGRQLPMFFDKNILHIILKNLISNALKYSPQNSTVELSVFVADEVVSIEVKDQGIGIPNQDYEQLFEAFYRGSNVGEIAGNGLGLAVVKNLVEVHEGEITVESTVEVGTKFTITLPIKQEK